MSKVVKVTNRATGESTIVPVVSFKEENDYVELYVCLRAFTKVVSVMKGNAVVIRSDDSDTKCYRLLLPTEHHTLLEIDDDRMATLKPIMDDYTERGRMCKGMAFMVNNGVADNSIGIVINTRYGSDNTVAVVMSVDNAYSIKHFMCDDSYEVADWIDSTLANREYEYMRSEGTHVTYYPVAKELLL